MYTIEEIQLELCSIQENFSKSVMRFDQQQQPVDMFIRQVNQYLKGEIELEDIYMYSIYFNQSFYNGGSSTFFTEALRGCTSVYLMLKWCGVKK